MYFLYLATQARGAYFSYLANKTQLASIWLFVLQNRIFGIYFQIYGLVFWDNLVSEGWEFC